MLEHGDLADLQFVCDFLERRRVSVRRSILTNKLEDPHLLGREIHRSLRAFLPRVRLQVSEHWRVINRCRMSVLLYQVSRRYGDRHRRRARSQKQFVWFSVQLGLDTDRWAAAALGSVLEHYVRTNGRRVQEAVRASPRAVGQVAPSMRVLVSHTAGELQTGSRRRR